MFRLLCMVSILLVTRAREKEAVCPPQADISPCTCEIVTPKTQEVWMTCGYISSLTELTASVKGMQGYEIDKFVLEHSVIGYIPSNMFLNTVLREIIIKSMKLDNIGSPGEVPFQNQEKTLHSIAIRRCNINSSIDWLKVSRLDELVSLELNKNNLIHFPARWFQFESNSLRAIYLMENEINAIDEKAFAAVPKLGMIDLSENRITKLSRSMFPMPAERLTYFIFNDNKITSLPTDMFTSMTALKRINLANNLLKVIDSKVWEQKFSQLTYLDLLGNEIQCDCKLLWTMDVYKPTHYYGECKNAVDGGTKKLSKIYPHEINNTYGC